MDAVQSFMSSQYMSTTEDTSDVRKILGRNVRSRREFLSLSQEELGLRINADQAYVSRLERGLLNPTLDSIVEVALALEIKTQKLFS